MNLVNIYKGETLPDGRTEIISGSVSQPMRVLVPTEKADDYVQRLKAKGSANFTVGNTVKDGKFVEIYFHQNQPKAQKYSVPTEKADEFISQQKKYAKTNLGIMLTSSAGLTALGTWGLSKWLTMKNKWIKYPLVGIGGLVALAASFMVSMSLMVPVLHKQEKDMMKKYDAQRLQ